MKLESITYNIFGTNLVIGSHIKRQIDYLKTVVPPQFQHRDMDDLGCGDGKVTMLLKDIFLPRRLRGFDINAALVKRARNRGIHAEIQNLDDSTPRGELAVLWGVLHHLEDCDGCLQKIKDNYSFIFIREPVRNGYVRWLEMGHTLRKTEIETLINEHLPGSQVHYCGNSILVFYVSPES